MPSPLPSKNAEKQNALFEISDISLRENYGGNFFVFKLTVFCSTHPKTYHFSPTYALPLNENERNIKRTDH